MEWQQWDISIHCAFEISCLLPTLIYMIFQSSRIVEFFGRKMKGKEISMDFEICFDWMIVALETTESWR